MPDSNTESRAPRVGHKKSRKGCAQCKRRRVKCNEEAPCANCVRHGVTCSLAGGPQVVRNDAKPKRQATGSSTASNPSKGALQEPIDLASAMGSSSSRAATPLGHFQILTGFIERPSLDIESSWKLDIELMHHYLIHTKSVLTEPNDLEYVVQTWQHKVPKVAFAFEYVLHGLLGLAALHKARLQPEDALELQQCAVQRLDHAQMLRQSDNTPVSAENASARFLFTWIVALCAYAAPLSLAPLDAMVELFMLVKEINASLSEAWFWVSDGPFQSILNRGFQAAIYPVVEGQGQYVPSQHAYVGGQHLTQVYRPVLPEGMDFGLGHLDFMLGVHVMMPEDRRTCSLILVELKQMYDSAVQNQVTCSVASIVCFPRHDSVNFAQLIKRRVPQALVILAYYCVLLDLLDGKWWIHGWATRVMRDVLGSLDEEWRHWIQWPVQAVLVKNEPGPLPSAGGGEGLAMRVG